MANIMEAVERMAASQTTLQRAEEPSSSPSVRRASADAPHGSCWVKALEMERWVGVRAA